MNETFEVVQAWLRYFTAISWVNGLGWIAAFWILMQMLPNTWAGGHLFDRKFAWISTMIAAILVFVIFVMPWVTRQLFVGILATAVLVALTALAKKYWR